MGGSQSTRKLSVDNDNVIQLSQEALDRIQAQQGSRQQPVQPVQQPTYQPPPYYETQKRPQDLAAEETYWARRIENLKRTHEKINSNMQLEYQKTLKEANDLYNLARDEKIAGKLPPCEEEKAKVLQCYSSNPGKSLLCSTVVSEFNDCVCKSRVAAMSAMS